MLTHILPAQVRHPQYSLFGISYIRVDFKLPHLSCLYSGSTANCYCLPWQQRLTILPCIANTLFEHQWFYKNRIQTHSLNIFSKLHLPLKMDCPPISRTFNFSSAVLLSRIQTVFSKSKYNRFPTNFLQEYKNKYPTCTACSKWRTEKQCKSLLTWWNSFQELSCLRKKRIQSRLMPMTKA